MQKDARAALAPCPPPTGRSEVTAALADYIQRSSLVPGDRLPAERELMSALAVGRSTIREVIRHFQALGVVEARKGSGTYLLKPISGTTIHMPLSLETTHLRDAAVEDAGSAPRHRSRSRHGRRPYAHGGGSCERSRKSSMRWSGYTSPRARQVPKTSPFTSAIYDATHNPLFKQLLEQMRGALERFWEKPFDRPDFARRSFPFHRTLFNAIAAQDPEAARVETLKILAIVEEDIKEMSR